MISFAPQTITAVPIVLDDVVFNPTAHRQIEDAVRCGVTLGNVLHDDTRFWFARKRDIRNSELSDWKPMRSAAEARAYLVSRVLG